MIVGIVLFSIFGAIGMFFYIIYIIWEYIKWAESCPSSPVISFEKFKILYDIDESKWNLWSDCPHFKDNGRFIKIGLSFKDYCKYEKFYEDIIKKKTDANRVKAQIDFNNKLDKYIESKISKIQNDLRKNTEELKQRTEDYKSDFDCINSEVKEILQRHDIKNISIRDNTQKEEIYVPAGISENERKWLESLDYTVIVEKERGKK